VNICIEDNILHVKIVDSDNNNKQFIMGTQSYSWKLHDTADIGAISASMNDGILELIIPYQAKEIQQIKIT
jgi:HSP20 family molecular chaperone IbpA